MLLGHLARWFGMFDSNLFVLKRSYIASNLGLSSGQGQFLNPLVAHNVFDSVILEIHFLKFVGFHVFHFFVNVLHLSLQSLYLLHENIPYSTLIVFCADHGFTTFNVKLLEL